MIKSGFMVRVTSWGNDGDCYNTKTFDGLSPAQVTSLVAFCCFMQDCKAELIEDVDFSKFKYFNGYVGFTGWDCDNSQEYFQEIYDEIAGYAYESEYMRVIESFDVHYIPSDLEDYSDKF